MLTRSIPGPRQRGAFIVRLALVAGVATTVLLGAGYYVLRTVMAPDWIRQNVIPAIDALYDRKTFFDNFELRPRSITLTGVRILEHPEFSLDGAPFLYVDRLIIGFDPFALLRRAFHVEFVRLVRPQLRLYQDERGTWNVASLFDPGRARSVPANPISRTNFRFVLTHLEIRDANVSVIRAPHSKASNSSMAIARDVDASVLFHPATGFLDYQARLDLELPAHERASLIVLGELDLSGPKVRFEISTQDLDGDALVAFLQGGPPGQTTVNFSDLVQADVEHELLLVGTDLKLGGIEIAQARLDVSASNRAIEVKQLDLTVFEGHVESSGRVDRALDPPSVSMSAKVTNLRAESLAKGFGRPDIARAAPGRISGTVSIAARGNTKEEILRSALDRDAGTGAPTGLSAAFDIALEEVDLDSLDKPASTENESKKGFASELGPAAVDIKATAKRVRNGSLDIQDLALDATINAGKITVRDAKGTVSGGTFDARGRITLSQPEPVLSGHLSLHQARYEEWIPDDPHWQWTETTGRVDADLDFTLRGSTPSDWLRALDEKTVEGRPRAIVDGRLAIAVEALDLDLVGTPPRVRDEYGPIPLGNVKLDLDIKSTRVRLWKLDYTDVEATGLLANNTIAVSAIRGAISDGTLELGGTVNLDRKGLAYSGQGAFSDVETSLFATTYLPPDIGRINGTGSASFEFNLTGTKGDSALDSLELDGYIALHSGSIQDSLLLEKISTTTGVKAFDQPELTRCGGDLRIKNRRVSTKRLVIGGSDARVFMTGSLGFDATLDLEVWLGFSPDTEREFFSRGILLPYITDDKGWTYVPFVATGPVKEPHIETTPEAVRSTAIRAIPDATERIVRESSKLVPGGETIVGGSIDAVKSILSGLGRVLQMNSARAKGETVDESRRPAKPSPSHAPANHGNNDSAE